VCCPARRDFQDSTERERPERGTAAPAHEWTDEDVAKLVAAARSLASRKIAKYDYAPLLELVARLGLRLGEVLGLQWQDFNKDEAVLHVRRQWLATGEYGPTKTAAGVRRIALPQDLRDGLIALRLRSGFSGDESPVFASNLGTPLSHRNVSVRGFEAARDEAGLPDGLTFHDLRHAAASRLIAAGLSPVAVAAVLGHEDATTTLRVYAHLWNREKTDEAVRQALAGGNAS
jgi:integrase